MVVEEEAAEEAEAAAADAAAEAADRQQQHDGGATESPVSSIAETRSRLLKDRVAEITYRDEPGVYLALVTETPAPRANKVSHLWLHEVLEGSDLYIMDPWNPGESKTPIRKVAEPLSSVQELPPVEAVQALAGEALRDALETIRSDPGARLQPGTLRVWRRARADPPSSATATGTSASAATLNRAAATSSASSAAATSSAAASSSTTDAASSGAAGSAQAGSSTVSSEAGLGISWTELEPTLYGRATQRRSSCPVPTDRYDEHLNDIIVHNMQDLSPWADSQDVQARAPISGMTIRAGSLFNRFKSGAPTGWVAKLFAGEAPTGRKLVMQRFPDGSEFGGHWHQLLFFVNQRQVLYHEPYGGAIDSRIASCFHRSPGPAAGWALEVVDVQLQSCTHECALWVDFVAEVAVDYVRSDLTRSFSEYLRGCALPVCVCACLR